VDSYIQCLKIWNEDIVFKPLVILLLTQCDISKWYQSW